LINTLIANTVVIAADELNPRCK